MAKKSSFILALLALCVLAGSSSGPVEAALQGPGTKTVQPDQWRTWWGQATLRKGTYTLQSQAPSAPAETHSALLTSTATWGDQVFSYTTTTLAQLRTGSTPNPWEVAWSMFRFTDLTHYYWFIVKPNGWELGKKHGSDTQVFLATGTTPRLPVGATYQVRIQAQGGVIRVSVNGSLVVDYTDPSPLLSGSVGLYEEDAKVTFANVAVTAL
jgi:hypothetical protein